jgi:hypothetical protein
MRSTEREDEVLQAVRDDFESVGVGDAGDFPLEGVEMVPVDVVVRVLEHV